MWTPDPLMLKRLAAHLRWDRWEHEIRARGITLDRPLHSRHPAFPEIIYPIDYGYVNGTLGTDNEPIDIFVGTSDHGLAGAIVTVDFRKGDVEVKLLYNCDAREIYLVNGFINYEPSLMMGRLVLRRPMVEYFRAP